MSNKTYDFYPYPNTTLCSVLESMRSLDKVKNYSALLGLIEQAQIMANSMENSLSDKQDVRSWSEVRNELKKDIRELKKEVRALEDLRDKLTSSASPKS